MFPTKIMVRGKNGEPTENYIEDKDFFPHIVKLSAELHNLSVVDYLLRFHNAPLSDGLTAGTDDDELLRHCLIAARNHVGNDGAICRPLLFDLLQAIHNWPKHDNDEVLIALNALAAHDNAVRRWDERNNSADLNESSENRDE